MDLNSICEGEKQPATRRDDHHREERHTGLFLLKTTFSSKKSKKKMDKAKVIEKGKVSHLSPLKKTDALQDKNSVHVYPKLLVLIQNNPGDTRREEFL